MSIDESKDELPLSEPMSPATAGDPQGGVGTVAGGDGGGDGGEHGLGFL